MPIVSSGSTSKDTTKSILHTDGNILEHLNWTLPQVDEDDVLLERFLSVSSSVVIPIALVGLVVSVIRYVRRDPIVIEDV